MNLAALQYFLEVSQCLSIRQASERLHVAASAVSRQISNLERILGCELLERHANGVILTEAGVRLERHARQLVAHLELVASDIDDLKSLRRGTVHISTVEGVTAHFLPDVITQFSSRFPDIRFQIEVMGTNKVLESINEYKCDLGLVYGLADDGGIDILAEYDQPLMAIVPRRHPLFNRKAVSLDELMTHDYVLPDSSFRINTIIFQMFRKYGIDRKPIIISNNLHFLQVFASSNNLILFLPVQAVFGEIAGGSMVAVDIDLKEFGFRKLSLCVRKHRTLQYAAVEFAEFLKDQFKFWELKDSEAIIAGRSRGGLLGPGISR